MERCCPDSNHKIIGETTRAWLRHAVRWWYAAMTHIDKQGGLFSAAETLKSALHGFRGAVVHVRWAVSIRMHYIARKFTKLVGVVADSERAKFNTVVSKEKDGRYQLTAPFTSAVNQVEQEVATTRRQQQQARDQRQRQRPRHQ